MATGPIVVIDDDIDDQELIASAFTELGQKNEILIFGTTAEAYEYLLVGEQPFFILCDINLPSQNGISFKRQVDEHPLLRKKSIPFIFLTTYPTKDIIDTAYNELTIQGVFKKPDTFTGLKTVLKCILGYWAQCKHPNEF